jgi:hypothetical protein
MKGVRPESCLDLRLCANILRAMAYKLMGSVLMKLSQECDHSHHEWQSIRMIASLLSPQSMDGFNVNEFSDLCYCQ